MNDLFDLVDLELRKHGETAKALCLHNGEKKAWFPKSLVEDNGDGTFTMPEWLAIEKDFI